MQTKQKKIKRRTKRRRKIRNRGTVGDSPKGHQEVCLGKMTRTKAKQN